MMPAANAHTPRSDQDDKTFTHLADAFIQSDLQCIQAIHLFSTCVPWESNPQPFALLTQCSNHRATGIDALDIASAIKTHIALPLM